MSRPGSCTVPRSGRGARLRRARRCRTQDALVGAREVLHRGSLDLSFRGLAGEDGALRQRADVAAVDLQPAAVELRRGRLPVRRGAAPVRLRSTSRSTLRASRSMVMVSPSCTSASGPPSAAFGRHLGHHQALADQAREVAVGEHRHLVAHARAVDREHHARGAAAHAGAAAGAGAAHHDHLAGRDAACRCSAATAASRCRSRSAGPVKRRTLRSAMPVLIRLPFGREVAAQQR